MIILYTDTSIDIHERKRRDKELNKQTWRSTNNNGTGYKPNLFVTVTPPEYVPIRKYEYQYEVNICFEPSK